MPENRDPAHVRYVGVDVSKAELEIAFEIGTSKTLPRRASRWRAWLEPQPDQVLHVIVEATGGLEHVVLEQCHALGVACSVVNPLRVRRFAEAIGKLAKTDPIDARVLASFGRATRPRPTEPLTPERRHLRSTGERSRRWWAWHRSPATVVPDEATDASTVAEQASSRPSPGSCWCP